MTEYGDFRILDEIAGTTQQGYELSRTAIIPTGHTVQVKIYRDTYRNQSLARASVFSAHLTLTEIAHDPPSRWHEHTPSREALGDPDLAQNIAEALFEVAASLFERAIEILAHAPVPR